MEVVADLYVFASNLKNVYIFQVFLCIAPLFFA